MRNVLAQNLQKTSHHIQRLFIEFSPCSTMQHIHGMTAYNWFDMNEVPFCQYKIRVIWENLERYCICSKRDKFWLTNSSIIVWNRVPISWSAPIVFICDRLNVNVSSVWRSATARMSSIAQGMSCGSAGLRLKNLNDPLNLIVSPTEIAVQVNLIRYHYQILE